MKRPLRPRSGPVYFVACLAAVATWTALAASEATTQKRAPREIHHRLDTTSADHARDVALTIDACAGAYDQTLISTLVRLQVPATVVVTRRWIDASPAAMRELLAHPTLFEIGNHGSAHVPAVVGGSVYDMHGARDAAGIEREIEVGAQAIVRASGRVPAWYRGAGFSLNADDGGTLGAPSVARRLRQARPDDIIIAHLNRPTSGTAAGLAAVLPELLARDLRFVTLSQATGVQPAPSPGAVS